MRVVNGSSLNGRDTSAPRNILLLFPLCACLCSPMVHWENIFYLVVMITRSRMTEKLVMCSRLKSYRSVFYSCKIQILKEPWVIFGTQNLCCCCVPKEMVHTRSHKGQWRGALMFSLIYAWINGWTNNPEIGDMRRYCAHYDVIVMG